MGDMADDFSWANGVSESMEEQEELQKKIEAFQQIDTDIKNGIKPF